MPPLEIGTAVTLGIWLVAEIYNLAHLIDWKKRLPYMHHGHHEDAGRK
jgi:hypothetical protein